MPRRRDIPPVARPTGMRLVIELCKDVLIVALLGSAIYLALQTPMGAQLQSWVASTPPPVGPTAQASGRAVSPYAVAVRSGSGLYGVSYDDQAVGRTFGQLSPFLKDALAAASGAQAITPRQWQILLESPGIYCVFQGRPSLAALAASLGGSTPLEGDLQALVLAWDGVQLWLSWQNGEACFRAPTGLSWEAELADELDDFSPNGAAFAYDLARSDDAYSALDPYVLVTMTTPQPQVYSAASPDFTGDSAALGALLSALDFLSGPDAAYETGGGLAVTENGDRLQVSRSGEITFRAGEEFRYPMAASARALPGEGEAVLCAWELLNRAAKSWLGAGGFVLTGASATDRGWEITFQMTLDGIPVLLGENSWCARFEVAPGGVRDFTLIPRSYSPLGETSLLTNPRLAAAALRTLPGGSGSLLLCYTDNRSAVLSAAWMSGE